ncbi:hypothetical protein VE00_07856 [Pseudogymnoascus sp. WSF 3629]|nr:hypothetical protein VE00_07856 [Pseudogymnoascus sp. WSF 3629]
MSSNVDQQASGRAGPNTAPNNYGPVIVDSATYRLTLISESPPLPGAVEALEPLTLREIGNSYIIDTPPTISHLVDTLLSLPTTPPSLYLSISGTSLGRPGASISLLQLLVLPTNLTYLLDIHTLGATAFTTPGTLGRTLKSILEDAAIPKVFFDIRNTSSALHATFAISLAGTHDIQLMELATRRRPRSKKFLHGIARCVASDLALGAYEKRRLVEARGRGGRLFMPKYGGGEEVIDQRPVGEEVAGFVTLDLGFLPVLWGVYEERLGGGWRGRVRGETERRVMESWREGYEGGRGRDRSFGPW